MTRISAINATGWILAAMMALCAGSAAAASRIVVRPPPRVEVRSPAVQPQQQLSFWGVRTNLQQYRDELQPVAPQEPRKRSRLHHVNSADQKQWPAFNQ
jgi:hypothetical protein